jgi:transcriptional regulator with XRE-family HTH domain
MKITSEFLRSERLRLDLSIVVVAGISELSPSTISGVERGIFKTPDLLIRIATALAKIETVRARYSPLPVDLNNFRWLMAEITKSSRKKRPRSIQRAETAISA